MVMESIETPTPQMVGLQTPTPQVVGLQFVRQYYTMLSKAPYYLHRFYTDGSSFVHDGTDTLDKQRDPVYGQRDIHSRILQLNFNQCYTKIKQIDSHATLGEGIVVQVSGELSNNGKSMRRFMQTFVLGQLSPMKYYVHNDIFRYQDEIFHDEDDPEGQEGCTESEVEEDHVDSNDSSVNVQEPAVINSHDQSLKNGSDHLVETPVQTGATFESAMPTTVSSSTIIGSVSSVPTSSSSVTTSKQTQQLPQTQQSETISNSIEKNDYASHSEEEYNDKSDEKRSESGGESSHEQSSNEPKTYATMASKNALGSAFTSPIANIPGGLIGPPRVAPGLQGTQPSPKSELRSENSNFTSSSNSLQPHRITRPRGGGTSSRGGGTLPRERVGRPNIDESSDMERRRPPSNHPDSHQLFVGNLMNDMTEDDLRSLFSKYGNVVDVRINTKQSAKPVPSFGFVIFDDSSPVLRVLGEKPIYQGEHRLNVEEKKTKPRDQRMNIGENRMMTGRSGMGRGGMMGGMRGRGGSMSMGRGGENRNRGGFGGPTPRH